MSQDDRFLLRVLRGNSDANTSFDELCRLLERLGFEQRTRSSHHIFRKPGVEERINLQRDGSQAKPYQVRQVRGSHRQIQAGRRGLVHTYEVIIYWSDEDQVFIAEAPELAGCVAHGPTQQAALENCQDAIALWVDTAREFGDPIPAPKGRRLMLA